MLQLLGLVPIVDVTRSVVGETNEKQNREVSFRWERYVEEEENGEEEKSLAYGCRNRKKDNGTVSALWRGTRMSPL